MANLTIRNVPEETVRRVKISAAENGRSMEAELRELMRRCYSPGASQPSLGGQAWVRALYDGNPPSSVVDDFLRHRREEFDD